MDGDDPLFEQGKWVRVWAVVLNQENVHPEDMIVRIRSHNSDSHVDVRRDYVVPSEFQPVWAEQCASMRQSNSSLTSLYMRCTRQAQHSRDTPHRNGNQEWTTADQNGNFEES